MFTDYYVVDGRTDFRTWVVVLRTAVDFEIEKTQITHWRAFCVYRLLHCVRDN